VSDPLDLIRDICHDAPDDALSQIAAIVCGESTAPQPSGQASNVGPWIDIIEVTRHWPDDFPDYNVLDKASWPVMNYRIIPSAEHAFAETVRDAERYRLQRDELLAAVTVCRDWLESQAKTISKGCGSPFELMAVREQRDLLDAAIAHMSE